MLKTTPRYSLLEVTLLTARKYHIRVHMADIGSTIVGDTRFSKKGDNYPL